MDIITCTRRVGLPTNVVSI